MDEILIRMAYEALENAYAPYSHFRVGAALRCTDGSIYTGCNVENAAYGNTYCAERTALVKAVSEGKRSFETIAIVSEKSAPFPCGACRQVLAEFLPESGDIDIIVAKNTKDYKIYKLSELLPMTFNM